MFKQHAFTLIESLLCVIIILVIMLFAAHNMELYRKTQQANLLTQELRHLVHYARQLALTQRHSLSLCGSSNGYHCDTNWSKGGLLFIDINRDGQLNLDERVIQYTPFALKHGKLSWNGFIGGFMRFESMGITAASNGTFTYCQTDNNPLFSRQVIVSRGGRARLSQDKNGDGYHEDVSGSLQINCP